jgi:hypothetical protein
MDVGVADAVFIPVTYFRLPMGIDLKPLMPGVLAEDR